MPEASLLHNEKQKPRWAGQGGGRRLCVAAASESAAATRLSQRGVDPYFNLQRSSGVCEPVEAPTRPTTLALSASAPAAPGRPPAAGPQSPHLPRGAPPAGWLTRAPIAPPREQDAPKGV